MTSSSTNELLVAARTSRGLTQAQLSKKTGIAQGVISKLEAGLLPLDGDRAAVLSSALDVPVGLLAGKATVADHVRVYHRKQASLPAKAAGKLHADLQLAHVQLSRLLSAHVPPLDVPRLPLPDDGYYTAADRAREVRKQWRLGAGPIHDMVALLESHGVVCLTWPVDSVRVDAIASWPDGEVPVLLMRADAPMDRVRFTLAHELGHGVLHGLPSAEHEAEADQFAAEFLFPAESARPVLQKPTMSRLAELKAEWGMSIAALVRRARDVGAISDSEYRSLNIEISAAGMRKSEPVELPPETPSLARTAIQDRLAAGETLEQIAAAALVSAADLQARYMETS